MNMSRQRKNVPKMGNKATYPREEEDEGSRMKKKERENQCNVAFF